MRNEESWLESDKKNLVYGPGRNARLEGRRRTAGPSLQNIAVEKGILLSAPHDYVHVEAK
jgi:hypothetical protein